MGTMESRGVDVISFIQQQHRDVRDLFDAVLAMSGEGRRKAFFALRRTLAVHETAEEEIIHPLVRRTLSDGDRIVAARLEEERAAKETLALLETLHPDGIEFEARFPDFRAAVLVHAEAEEEEELSRLAAALDASQLARLGRVVELAERIAPTRPHPGIESATANLVVGPFVAIVDRARDALEKKA